MLNHIKRAVFAIVLATVFQIRARVINIIVASESRQKIAAVETAFGQKFPNDTIRCIGYRSVSLVPNQPVGIDVAKRGVRNRLDSLPQDLVESAYYAVSIENYIEQSSSAGHWYDRGLILLNALNKGLVSREHLLLTQSVLIPDRYIELAKQSSSEVSAEGYSATVGSVIQKVLTDRLVDQQDWHKEPEFGGVSRASYLQDSLYKGLCADELDFIKSFLVYHADFPKPGIIFANFLPILNSPKAFQMVIDILAERYRVKSIDVVVGLESRGFILGSALAYKLGIGFVPVRKPGKLPGETYAVSYKKEYGTDTLVISQNSFKPNQRVLIIDDLIATGGSARAAIELVKLAGGEPVEFVSLLKIDALEEQARLGIPTFNLID